MRKNRKFVLLSCFATSILLLSLFFFSHCSLQQGEPQIEISLEKRDISSQTIMLHIVVTNVGKYRLVIPRLQEEKLQQYWEWGGWTYIIQERHHSGFFLFSDRRSTFAWTDLVTLHPGESFTVTLNIAGMKWMSPYSGDPSPQLSDINGVYDIRVELNLGKKPTGESNIPFFLNWTVWQGSIRSNTITFVIEHN